MTDHAHIDFFETPFPEIACRMQERAQEAEKKAERYDLALCALERMLSLELAQGKRLVSVGLVLDHLGSAAQYGASGLRGRAIDGPLAALEAALGRPPV